MIRRRLCLPGVAGATSLSSDPAVLAYISLTACGAHVHLLFHLATTFIFLKYTADVQNC